MHVTAVMPVHNHERWVRTALESLLKQTRRPDRFAIVENGSIDDSRNVIKRMLTNRNEHSEGGQLSCSGFLDGIPTWFYSTSTALGPATARNYGMEIFRNDTDVFAFLDSDDIYEPTKIEASLPFFENKHVGVVYSDYTTFNEQTGIEVREYKEPFSYLGLQRDCIINCDSLVAKEAVLSVGGFDNSMRTCEDYDLWLRLCRNCIAVHIPESLVKIRVGNHSSTANVPKETWNSNWAKIREKMRG